MKRGIGVYSLLILVFVFSLSLSAFAQTNYYVAIGGSNGAAGSSGAPWLTIQYAIDTAAGGDIINVAAGTYTENVVINKGLSLQGVSGAIIAPATGIGVEIQASNVTVNLFTVTPLSTVVNAAQGITITTAALSTVTISNNTITTVGVGGHGIYVAKYITDFTVTGNTITVGAVATVIYADAGPTQAQKSSTWTISGNTLEATDATGGVNMELYDVDAVTIDNNIFKSTAGSNVIVSSEKFVLTGAIVFTNNDVQGNVGGSMVAFLRDFTGGHANVTTIDDVTITGNTFNNWATRGLRIGDGVTTVTVNTNEFLATGDALQWENTSAVNLDAENNFWGSTNGPEHSDNTFNVGFQGGKAVESGNSTIDYVPWYNTSKTGTTFAPVNNTTDVTKFSSIKTAIDASATANGETITAAAGTYTENVVINKGLSLQGVSGAIIAPATGIGVEIQASNVTVNLFTVTPLSTVVNAAQGITITTAALSTVTISNNTITTVGVGGHGIYVAKYITDFTVTGNTITVGAVATVIYADAGPTQAQKSSTWTISGNTLEATDATGGVNMELYDVDAVTIDNNIFKSTAGSNVIVSSEKFVLTGAIVFTNNDVQGNVGGSMVAFLRDFTGGHANVTTIDDVTITGNTFNNWATRGLRIGDGVTTVTVNTNEFLDTGDALQWENSSAVNLDAENNFWGDSSGPGGAGPGTGAAAVESSTGTIDFDPWYVDAGMALLSSALPTVGAIEDWSFDAVTVSDPPPIVNVTVGATVDIVGAVGTGIVAMLSYSVPPVTAYPLPGSETTPTMKYIDIFVSGLTAGTSTIKVTYTAADVSGFDENTVTLYMWYGSKWNTGANPGRNTSSNEVWGDFDVTNLTGTPGGVGEGEPPIVIPTLNEWGMIILITLLIVVAIIVLKKQKKYAYNNKVV